MKIFWVTLLSAVLIAGALIVLYPRQETEPEYIPPLVLEPVVVEPTPEEIIKEYLEGKQSPLAGEVEFLMEQKHWRLLIAISAIESQYCKRQLGYNCWGIINGKGGYRSYSSFREAIIDADALISKWQAKGRWLTVSDMNGHYVYPYNPNWEWVVNDVLQKLDDLQK